MVKYIRCGRKKYFYDSWEHTEFIPLKYKLSWGVFYKIGSI